MQIKISILSVFTILPLLTFAQKGIVRGTVIDSNNGHPLPGVTTMLEGTTIGAVSDFDGKFEIKAEPGKYNLQFSYISYSKFIIEDVELKPGEVTVIDAVKLTEDVEQLAEVVVTAEAIKTTEEALMIVKRKSANVLDGISSSNFRRLGDSDAASAIKRVPGVSIEGGKYVYVRGLGDRYSKSTLNGVDIPGLDPDRNTIQMDMFPTSLIDNIMVKKTFTADLPADFTGGIVNIETKGFPDEKNVGISVSLGYNPSMHLNNNYITYEGGSTDFLGFDDGTRALPISERNMIQYVEVVGRTDSEKALAYNQNLKSFNPTLSAIRSNSLLDYGFGFNYGNQSESRNNKIGYNFSLNYSNSTEYYEEAVYARYGKDNTNIFKLDKRDYQIGDFGINNVNLSGIAGLALKKDHAKYKLNILHTQNGESKAGVFNYENSDLGANFTAFQHNLEYSERSLTNIFLGGEHHIINSNWNLEWKISPTRSRIQDPDIRFTRYRVDGSALTISSESGYPERIWRFLKEDNLVGKVDATKNIKLFGNDGKLMIGTQYVYKHRDYEIKNFQVIPQGVDLTGNPDEIFDEENLWPSNPNGSEGTRYEPMFIPNNPNKYGANVMNTAGYFSAEILPVEKIKAIIGFRFEQYTQLYSGENQQGLELQNEKVLNDIDLFPSFNFIYSLDETQNLRFSYSKTIARPSFKEASYAEILDALSGRTFIGGFFKDINASGEIVWDGNLTATRIDNLDLRWETFKKAGQMISVSTFYKYFKNPIEMVQYVQAPNNFQPRNVGDGQLVGFEFEVRKNLEMISPALKSISFNTNVTITESRIQMSTTEFHSRLKNARDGEEISNNRKMAGQAPYIINSGISYNGIENNLEIGINYNVQGKTLQFVGVADRPDVFSVPFHSLNLVANKNLGVKDQVRLGLKINNILGSERQNIFESYGAENQIMESLTPGTSINFSFGYQF